MKPTRRSFIKTLAVGILGNGLISGLPLEALSKTEENGIEIQKGFKVFNLETQKSMEALAETLVPGAKEIGIRSIFMDYISKDPGLAGFLDAGFWNLDTISKTKFKKPFYQLTKKEEKKAVIDHVSVRNRMFFTKFRETVIKLYYSNPAVWKKLSYSGPPQPRGFMDYFLPPKVKKPGN
jgi:hypothetical protein